MSRTTTSRRALTINLLVMVCAFGLLQACGNDKKAPPAINPHGYYINTGTLTVQDNGGTPRTDLQAMVHGTRFIMTSVQGGLVYDGTITQTGNTFTGTLSVFTNGTNPSTTTVAGTINQGVGITGTLTGTGAGSGTFSLNYTAASNQAASMVRVAETLANPTWESFIGGSTSNLEFILSTDSSTSTSNEPTNGSFRRCGITTINVLGDPGIIPISGTSLYSVHVKVDSCDLYTDANTVTAGDYTGLAASRSDSATDDTLVLVITSANGAFSISGDFK